MDERPSATLVTEALAGQKEAFSALVYRYQDYAYGVAIGMLSDFELARDVVQEAFLCAYRDLRKLRDPARFGGWLHSIVKHTAHRALRELERVHALAEELSNTAEPFARTPSPDQSAEDAERRAIVRRALERLNEKNREAVSLYYVDGLSYSDIAEFLDVTEATVQGRLQRARAKLREELEMVEDTFREEALPDDFTAEIKALIDATAERGQEHERAVRRLAEIGAPAVDPLCEALRDPRQAVRIAAAHVLCAIGDPRALRPVLRLLYAEDSWVYQKVFRKGKVLGIPGARQELLRILREGEADDQYWAIQVLSNAAGDDEVYDCLYAFYKDPKRTGNRCQALWALCSLRPESGTGLITEALHDPDLHVRGLACWFAVAYGFLPPTEAILNAFGDGMGWGGRLNACRLMLKHGEGGREALEQVLRTGSAVERSTAAVALAPTGSEEVFDILKEELLGVPRNRKWANVVSQTLIRSYGGELVAWVEAEGFPVAGDSTVAWTLTRGRVTPAESLVDALFREGAPSVRAAAVRILARQKGAAFLPELRRCLAEGRPRKVAQEAFWQVYRLRDAALPTAEEMLGSEKWTERKAAVCLLRRWGKLTSEQKAQAEADAHVAVRIAAN